MFFDLSKWAYPLVTHRNGAEEAHWAHNPRVGGSKPPFDTPLFFASFCPESFWISWFLGRKRADFFQLSYFPLIKYVFFASYAPRRAIIVLFKLSVPKGRPPGRPNSPRPSSDPQVNFAQAHNQTPFG